MKRERIGPENNLSSTLYISLIFLGRIRDISSRKILDTATRKRRQKRQLEALEKDNFQDDPHSHLTVVPAKMKVPAFNDTMEGNYHHKNVENFCDGQIIIVQFKKISFYTSWTSWQVKHWKYLVGWGSH